MIKGFWHCYLTSHWYSIVTDQLRILLTSGLYDACQEISIGCVGTEEEKAFFEKCFTNLYPKLKIKYYGTDPKVYEFPTLHLIELDTTRYYGFYFHTKGVTKPELSVIGHWRAWLNEAILNNWRFHYQNIIDGYDVSGVNHMKSPDHFSGNYWWFNRNYIDRIKKLSTLDQKDRYMAEQWICMSRYAKIYKGEFKEPGRDVFVIKCL